MGIFYVSSGFKSFYKKWFNLEDSSQLTVHYV